MNDKELGTHIRTLRLSAGLTQKQVAEEIPGWYPATVYKVEDGQRSVKATELIVLSDLFGSTTDDLLGRGEMSKAIAQAQQKAVDRRMDEIRAELKVLEGCS